MKVENLLGEPDAGQSNQKAPDADEREFDSLPPPVSATLPAEGPVPVAEPVAHDGNGGRGDRRPKGTVPYQIRIEHGRAKEVEEAHVDDETDQPDHADARELRDQFSHA